MVILVNGKTVTHVGRKKVVNVKTDRAGNLRAWQNGKTVKRDKMEGW